jgi:hypothetical protein
MSKENVMLNLRINLCKQIKDLLEEIEQGNLVLKRIYIK